MKKPILSLFFTLPILMTQCKKDSQLVEEPLIEITEEEVITSLIIHLHRTDIPGDTVSFAFRDTDGPGGNPPSEVDTIQLASNGQYACSLEVLDESNDVIRDITIEILAEGQDHLFCFESIGTPIVFDRTDWDGMYEIGLQSAWTASNAGTGEVRIILKHQPGIKNGTCEPGETDIEVYFPLVVE